MSIIARIYGIFKIQTNSYRPFYIMIMQNVCKVIEGTFKLKFDLKGSIINRKVNAPTFRGSSKLDCKKVLKDVNFI